jgi:hypothetical protein
MVALGFWFWSEVKYPPPELLPELLVLDLLGGGGAFGGSIGESWGCVDCFFAWGDVEGFPFFGVMREYRL